MNTIRVVGIDIAKSVFQVCVWMVDGSIAYNRRSPVQIAGLRSTLRARNAYRDGGMLYFALLGQNLQNDGIQRQTDTCPAR